MSLHRKLFVLWLPLALVANTANSANAQTPAPPATATPVVCTDATELVSQQLYGEWQLSLWTDGGSTEAPASRGVVRFERHPEYPGSVRGQVRRSTPADTSEALVSGDVIEGAFNLDESADGINMDAVWVGTPGDCGREIRGLRRPAEGRPASEPTLNFLLRKSPGWG